MDQLCFVSTRESIALALLLPWLQDVRGVIYPTKTLWDETHRNDTVHLCCTDRFGNMVSATPSGGEQASGHATATNLSLPCCYPWGYMGIGRLNGGSTFVLVAMLLPSGLQSIMWCRLRTQAGFSRRR